MNNEFIIETLEEAAERLIKLNRQDAFYEGAKWQAERMIYCVVNNFLKILLKDSSLSRKLYYI